jgi:hypothetical protein
MHERLKQAARVWLKVKLKGKSEALAEADLMLEDALVDAGFPVIGDPIETVLYRSNQIVVTLESNLKITIPLERYEP